MASWRYDDVVYVVGVLPDKGDHTPPPFVLMHKNEVRVEQSELHANVGPEQSTSYLGYPLFF
jgi:hypothetical protein